MISRRSMLALISAVPTFSGLRSAIAQDSEDILDQIEDLEFNAPFDIDAVKPYGNEPPTQQELHYAATVLEQAPSGPSPIDIVDYFLEVGQTDEDGISQWPRDGSWNPLIVEFFKATNYGTANDMVPWCAAFVNWCLERNNKRSSNSAASQSFLNERFYARTEEPVEGDLVVFTCFHVDTGRSTNLGHVAFYSGRRTNTHIAVKGGNQTKNSKSMICEKSYPVGPVRTTRSIGGRRVPVDFRFNSFIKVV